MTNIEKDELRYFAKQGLSFKEIRKFVECSDGTIRAYIKTFNPKPIKSCRIEIRKVER